jgi:uracil phosphoribosyltransferase
MILEHPLVMERIAILRDRATGRPAFRDALADLSTMLVYEACRELPVSEREVETPLATAPARRPAVRPCLVPILRAGIGMLEPALRLLPDADVGFLGVKRDEETLGQVPYLNTIPPDLVGRPVFVLEPMVATGGTAALACGYVAEAGARDITVLSAIASAEGASALEVHRSEPTLVVGAVDPELNDAGFIVPGLGDAGDRQFGAFR